MKKEENNKLGSKTSQGGINTSPTEETPQNNHEKKLRSIGLVRACFGVQEIKNAILRLAAMSI